MPDLETLYVPDPALERPKLEVIAEALAGGILDMHLRFVEREFSPSAAIDDADYGYMPTYFRGDLHHPRPSKEPLDWRAVAATTLGLDRNVSFPELAAAIRRSSDGWLPFLTASFGWGPDAVDFFKKASKAAFDVGVLTENDLPGYARDIYSVTKTSDKTGEVLEEELGIWSGEEYEHSHDMSIYGEITDRIGDALALAARVSQLRRGSSADPRNVSHTKVYTTGQEWETYLHHLNDAAIAEPVLHALLGIIGRQEVGHHVMFRGEVKAVLQAFPDDTVQVIESAYRKPLEMPGAKGIPRFMQIAIINYQAGLLTPLDAYNSQLQGLKYWGIFDGEIDSTLKTDEGKQALDALRHRFSKAPRIKERDTPFVLGKTVTKEALAEARQDYLEQLAA